jgi:RNA polymerase sigma-70 factor, ECF subfamily
MTDSNRDDSPPAGNPAPPGAPGVTADAPSDRSLLRRLRGGSDDAATELYRRYAHRLRALARANTSTHLARRVDAEDIVQSVFRIFFAAASQGLYDVPAGEDLWKLLLVIALNKIRAEGVFHQAAKRDVRATAELDRLDSSAEPEDDDDFATSFLRLVVRDTLERLPEAERQMMELRMEGYEIAEIARALGRSKRTVERCLQQARTRLKSLLDEDL